LKGDVITAVDGKIVKNLERFQDICLASEGEELFLVPDYREELETLLRETEK